MIICQYWNPERFVPATFEIYYLSSRIPLNARSMIWRTGQALSILSMKMLLRSNKKSMLVCPNAYLRISKCSALRIIFLFTTSKRMGLTFPSSNWRVRSCFLFLTRDWLNLGPADPMVQPLSTRCKKRSEHANVATAQYDECNECCLEWNCCCVYRSNLLRYCHSSMHNVA